VSRLNIVEIATQLADTFRGTAAEYDRSAEFPTANYDQMREAGYLRAAVPEELGGLGAGLADMARAQQALARGCASTALAVNMHQFQVGAAADAWRNGGPTEPLLRRVADEGPILASTGAEAIVAGPWSPSTTAEKQDGEWVLNGRRFFCSQAPGMNVLRVNARDVGSGDFLVFSVPGNAAGMTVVETWDTTGMRATASHDVVLENVRVPEAALGANLGQGEPLRAPPFANVGRWFLPLASGVYLGIAEEARAEAMKAIGKGINTASRHDVLTDVMVGEMEAAFLMGNAVLQLVVRELDAFPQDLQWALSRAILCKEIVTAKAVEVVDKAVQVAGAKSYYRKSPLERLARDVRAGRFHPPAPPVSFQMAGARVREQAVKTSA
jgi:acyl-CoA dehydrogenase